MAEITLSMVAEKVGVSAMTVSATLRGTGRVGKATRQRVLAAATELGYRPNASAQAVRTGRFNTVALLLSTDEDQSYLPPAMTQAIHDALAEHNLNLTIARLPDRRLAEDGAVPRILRAYAADGLLIDYTFGIPPRLAQMIDDTRTPAIYLNTVRKTDCVHVDEVAGGRRLTEHLLALGHRRIAYVDTWWGRDTKHAHHSVTDRRTGYATAMEEAGLTPRFLLTHRATPDQQRSAMATWLTADDAPTAIVTYWTSDTWPLLAAAAATGKTPGRDLSIATFSRPDDHATFGFDLTYLSQPETAMGLRGVKLLIERMNNADARPQPPLVLRGRLIQGATTAANHEDTEKGGNR